MWHLFELKKLIELFVCPPRAQLWFMVKKNRIQGFSLHVREARDREQIEGMILRTKGAAPDLARLPLGHGSPPGPSASAHTSSTRGYQFPAGLGPLARRLQAAALPTDPFYLVLRQLEGSGRLCRPACGPGQRRFGWSRGTGGRGRGKAPPGPRRCQGLATASGRFLRPALHTSFVEL